MCTIIRSTKLDSFVTFSIQLAGEIFKSFALFAGITNNNVAQTTLLS